MTTYQKNYLQAFPSTEVQKTAIDSLLCQSINNTITTNREAKDSHEKVITRDNVYLHFKELTTIKNLN